MAPFSGFNSATSKAVPIPVGFFSELLTEISDLDELRVTLWVFHCLDLQEGDLRYLTRADFVENKDFIRLFGRTGQEQIEKLDKAIEATVHRGVLISAQNGEETLFFLNSPRGRATLESLSKEAWQADGRRFTQSNVSINRPNIFLIYEQNIGPLTPFLADELWDAESEYPEEWIVDAFKIAVNKNVRNWHYVSAILRSWKEKGRDERDQRSTEKNRKLDSEGEYGDYILH